MFLNVQKCSANVHVVLAGFSDSGCMLEPTVNLSCSFRQLDWPPRVNDHLTHFATQSGFRACDRQDHGHQHLHDYHLLLEGVEVGYNYHGDNSLVMGSGLSLT